MTAPSSSGPAPLLVLTGSGAPPCAVDDFNRRLAAALGAGEALALAPGTRWRAVWRALSPARGAVESFPVVAWKRELIRPLLALALARLRGRAAIVVLHEWAALNRLRRLALLPALATASRVVLLSPTVRDEVAADPLARGCLARSVMAPLAPNLGAPPAVAGSPLAARLAAARSDGRLVVGHFGSIYAGKGPETMLAVAAALKAQGARPLLVFVGDFIRSAERIEAVFAARVAALGLAEDVVVSGYVAGMPELYGLFAEVDVFAYAFAEGLTARRSSVLASVQSGRPVVVTAPARADEFDHHPRYAALVAGGALTLVPRDAAPDAFARAILAAAGRPAAPAAIDLDAWWADTAEAVRRAA
jgi:glycosyltransferase involved in cell wall biosynthesis